MIAEIHHKVFSNLEDELTGNFFGTMRYIPFQRGMKQIYMKCIHSLDESVHGLIRSIQTNDFDIEFWKRSELGYGEIDGYMELDGVGIGLEEIYQRNYRKECFADVHLAYITWQDILSGLDEIRTVNQFEDLMVEDLKGLLREKGFMSFEGFRDNGLIIDGGAFYDFG